MILDADRKSENATNHFFDADRDSDDLKTCIMVLTEGRTKREKDF